MSHHTADPICQLCEEKLAQAHPYLATWFRSKKKVYPNAHVAWSFRNAIDQEQAYADGKSKLHFPNSAHNKTPAEAIDLFQIDEDGVGRWSPSFFAKLNAENESDREPILWGGMFRHLGDGDHYQIDLAALDHEEKSA